MKRAMIPALVAAAALSASAWAQNPDPHHPAEAGAPPAATRPPTPPQAGMGGMDMMRMMQGMRMMGGPGMAGMGMIDRIEGRLAFLRAELKITETQANAWNTFAEALRANAQKLAAVRPAMMGSATQALPDRLDTQERWLTARLEGMRAIRTAFTPLFSLFSDEQKKTASELLGSHLGLPMMSGMMGMGQMGPMGAH
jgi:LTXXQ motif family protein